MINYSTPVISYKLKDGRQVLVKRDDLAGDYPAPPLGKLRGIYQEVLSYGRKTVGVVDRSPASRNSWAYAYVCKQLGLPCKAFGRAIGRYQLEAIKLGAEYRQVDGYSPEEIYRNSFKEFYDFFPEDSIMPRDDCHSQFIIDDTFDEVVRTRGDLNCDTLVIPTGSGGLAVGVLKGLAQLGVKPGSIVLHLAGSRRLPAFVAAVLERFEIPSEYLDRIRYEGLERHLEPLEVSPFPANPTYEAKAWDWLERSKLGGRILFWNAGA